MCEAEPNWLISVKPIENLELLITLKLLHVSANSNSLQISISEMHVVKIALTLSFLYETQYLSCSKPETDVQSTPMFRVQFDFYF